MFRFLIVSLFLLFGFSSFSQEKVVQLKYANGNPQVVYYYETIFLRKTLVKKEFYYENGNLEYSGQLRNGKEHGEWKYYHSNGQLKAQENWSYGKENGEWKEFDSEGKLIRKTVYKTGKMIKTTDY